MENDQYFMQKALLLAKKGMGFTSPNPMVGAIVVSNGQIVGQGFHERVGAPHAEVNALNEAGEKAKGGTIYVTLEPCNHFGRTPPCTEKIIKSGLKRVVIGMRDPNPQVKGGGTEYLSEKGLQIDTGMLQHESEKLNESFIKYSTTQKPFVIVKCAATLDGQIATSSGDSKWITNELSRRHVHLLRHQVDAILVGKGTIAQDNPQLTTRIDNQKGKDPIRIVLDTNLTIDDKANILNIDSCSETIIVVGEHVESKRIRHFENAKCRILPCVRKENKIDLSVLMGLLGKETITSILVEGGGEVIGAFLRDKLVDKMQLFYAPKILGGNDGRPMFKGKGAQLMKHSIKLKNINVSRFEDDIMIEGYL